VVELTVRKLQPGVQSEALLLKLRFVLLVALPSTGGAVLTSKWCVGRTLP